MSPSTMTKVCERVPEHGAIADDGCRFCIVRTPWPSKPAPRANSQEREAAELAAQRSVLHRHVQLQMGKHARAAMNAQLGDLDVSASRLCSAFVERIRKRVRVVDGRQKEILGVTFTRFRYGGLSSSQDGLLLQGTPGTGKTWAACAVANAIALHGCEVMFVTPDVLASELEREARLRLSPAVVHEASTVDVLVLDDLGTERFLTRPPKSQLMEIIRRRANQGLPIIATTNLELGDLCALYEDPRVGDRLIAMFARGICKMQGRSRRR